MENPTLRKRLSEFCATLDLKCEIPESLTAKGITPFLENIFKGKNNFWKATEKIQNLKGKYRTEKELIDKVAELLRQNPRNFLILTHLHRQLRFTNLELVHFFFDRQRLNDPKYFVDLLRKDNVFKDVFMRTIRSKRWRQYIGEVDLRNLKDPALLACFKKTVTKYLGSESNCWPLWKARIENDATVCQRIAEFVVKNEDLPKLIETDSIKTALERSLRTVNVEILKRKRGAYGSRRVKDILESAGFIFKPYSNIKDLEDLERIIRTRSTLFSKTTEYIYTTEKLWKKEDKRFDFILISKKRVQFVIETNYFTTSMSKIREVVRHFIELKKACRGKYRLIYITDGMGWFSLTKDIKGMLEFEIEEQRIEPSKVPFLMNLELFRQSINQIKSEMR